MAAVASDSRARAMIASAFSLHSGVAPAMLIDDQTRIRASTSAATSFVAGLIALLLQREPGIEPARVTTLLRRRGVRPGHARRHLPPQVGLRLVDAAKL